VDALYDKRVRLIISAQVGYAPRPHTPPPQRHPTCPPAHQRVRLVISLQVGHPSRVCGSPTLPPALWAALSSHVVWGNSCADARTQSSSPPVLRTPGPPVSLTGSTRSDSVSSQAPSLGYLRIPISNPHTSSAQTSPPPSPRPLSPPALLAAPPNYSPPPSLPYLRYRRVHLPRGGRAT
jgi:hypothetical protein